MPKLFLLIFCLIVPFAASAKEPPRFASLDSEKRVWVIDIAGKNACLSAAHLLASDRKLRLADHMPLPGENSYMHGCMVSLRE